MFDRNNYIAFDVETRGDPQEYALQPFRVVHRQAVVRSYSIAYYDEAGKLKTNAWLDPDRVRLHEFLEYCAKYNKTIVGWNVAFDAAWLIANGLEAEVMSVKWLDAMLLWRHLAIEPEYDMARSKKKSFSLKMAVAEEFPEHAGYEDGIDFEADDEAGIAALLKYNQLDSAFTLKLAERYAKRLTPEQWRNAKIEAACIPMVAKTTVLGLRIDLDAAKELDIKLEQIAGLTLGKLQEAEPAITPAVLSSPKQLSHLLYSEWELPVFKQTKTGDDSTDKEALHELSFIDPRAKLVRAFREATGNRTKFVTNTQESVEYNGDGCTRPQARIFGTYTGRMTFSSKQGKGKSERPTGVALHQWKRDPMFRNLILPPEGYDLLEFDFSGQEFRWMAVASGDEQMLTLCMPGEDAHGFMGSQIAGWDYRHLQEELKAGSKEAKNHRQLGKVGNLSLQYRTSAAKLRVVSRVQYGLPMELPEAAKIHRTYQRVYPKVPEFWAKQIAMCKRQGFAETYAGRRVQLEGWGNKKLEWSLGSTAINYRIQGTGADQKYLALMFLKDYLPKVGGHFYFELHDGVFIIVPKHESARAAHEVRKLLSNLPYEKAWGIQLPIQFPVDAKVGPSWGALKEVKE